MSLAWRKTAGAAESFHVTALSAVKRTAAPSGLVVDGHHPATSLKHPTREKHDTGRPSYASAQVTTHIRPWAGQPVSPKPTQQLIPEVIRPGVSGEPICGVLPPD